MQQEIQGLQGFLWFKCTVQNNITDGTVAINGLPLGSFLIFLIIYSVSDFNERVKDRDKWNYNMVLVRTKGK